METRGKRGRTGGSDFVFSVVSRIHAWILARAEHIPLPDRLAILEAEGGYPSALARLGLRAEGPAARRAEAALERMDRRGFRLLVLGEPDYPTLLAAIGDVARPSWRASAVGVYRLWRDLGYAIGALLAGLTADLFGLTVAMWVIAGLTFVSGVVSATRMTETLPARVLTTSR